jgi:antitoxin HigA-1
MAIGYLPEWATLEQSSRWLKVQTGEARLWLAAQSAFDVWQVQERFKVTPRRVQAALAVA